MEPLGHCGLLMHKASTAQEGVPHPGTEDKATGHDHSNAVSRGKGLGGGECQILFSTHFPGSQISWHIVVRYLTVYQSCLW